MHVGRQSLLKAPPGQVGDAKCLSHGMLNNLRWRDMVHSVHCRYQRISLAMEMKGVELCEETSRVASPCDHCLG